MIVSYLLVTDVSIQLVSLQMHHLVPTFVFLRYSGSWNNFMRHHEIVYDDGLNHVLYPHAGACAAVPLFTSLWPNVSGSNVERQVTWFVTRFVLIHFLPVHTVKSCFRVILFIKLGAFAKSEKRHFSFATFIRPHGTTELLLDGFYWNLIFVSFSKIWRVN